ncbi:MAG: PqqD family protein [Chloroflexota bacterium]
MTSLVHYRINSPEVIAEIIDGEAVLVNLDTGDYYSLDKVGAEMWDLIISRSSVKEIVQTLVGRYDAEPLDLEDAVLRLIEQLQQEELIVAARSDTGEGISRNAPTMEAGAEEGRLRFERPVLRKYSDMQDLLTLDPIHEVDDSGWPNRA